MIEEALSLGMEIRRTTLQGKWSSLPISNCHLKDVVSLLSGFDPVTGFSRFLSLLSILSCSSLTCIEYKQIAFLLITKDARPDIATGSGTRCEVAVEVI